VGRYDRLSPLDSSFLHIEDLEAPMHIGALAVLEGGPFFDEHGAFRLAAVRDLVMSRLDLIPRFRRRLQHVPFGQGRPIWVDDPHFDIAYHVRLTALPSPGTREQLLTLCSRVQAGLLDRTRPLWELWFVEGLEGGHVALIQKTHHALVDGVSGVDVATVLLDFAPEPPATPTTDWQPEPVPSPANLFVDSIVERATQPAELGRSVRGALRRPREGMRRAGELARSFTTILDRHLFAPHTALNARVGRNRRLEAVRIHLDDVKAVRRSLGGTVNDVVLAAVAGALRRYFTGRGDPVDGLVLRALCPVSVRDDDERLHLGNRVSAMIVPLPVGIADPGTRFDALRSYTSDLKERRQAVGAAFLVDLTTYAAPTLLGAAARLVHRQPFVNVVVTNIPGPQVPLYLMGARMLEAYPIVPLARNLAVGVALFSYCGYVHLGVFGDPDALPDLAAFAAALDDSFAELAKIATDARG